jgi:nucleoside-diphosphate-sugar epimerase
MLHPIVLEDIAKITAARLPWDRLRGQTVLVTGAGGFLAAYIIRSLLHLNDHQAANIQLKLLVRDPTKANERLGDLGQRRDVAFVVQDVCSPVPAALRADVIIHAAGHASPKHYASDPIGTMLPNVVGTQLLLEKAVDWGTRHFLFFSTSEVYGRLPSDKIPTAEESFGELDPINPRSCYAEAKRVGEALCVAWHRQKNVPAVIVRPFHTYGPGLRLDDGRVFADFVADVLANRPITLRSDGKATRSFCYLADAVQGFFTVLFHGQPATAYNVGDPRGEVSMRDLADLLVRTFPDRPLSIRFESRQANDQYMPSQVQRSCPDIRRMKALGWEPTTRLIEGFKRTVQSCL